MVRLGDRPREPQPELLVPLTAFCWAVTLVGGALVVAMAANASIYRCVDGWTNRGQEQWLHAIAALVLNAPSLGRAAWLVIGRKGSYRLRWAAVAVAVAAPIMTIAFAFRVLPDAPVTGTCFD